MECLRQHSSFYPRTFLRVIRLSAFIYKKAFFFAIWRRASVWYKNNSYRRTNRFLCRTMGGYNTEVFLATPMRIISWLSILCLLFFTVIQ